MRDIIVAGNWKMNTNPWEGVNLAREVATATVAFTRPIILICPPATHLAMIKAVLLNTCIQVGAQNVHWEKAGAYTGEISVEMLSFLGIGWTIVGHSERRRLFGETDETVNLRARRALDAGIRPILCIGETLEEREAGKTLKVLESQLRIALKDLELKGRGGLVIAYEPVWAIGTGRTATPDQAQEAHAFIRAQIKSLKSKQAAVDTSILYGGSVTDENARALMNSPDLDGALVGGASLKAEKFAIIVEAAHLKE